MTRGGSGNLRLGSNVIELLLPQRRPFLMVDFVQAFREEPVPTLEAGRHISSDEVFFDGHFPGLHLWPGTLTQEGLGQAATILMVLLELRRRARKAGEDPEAMLEALRNVDRGFRMHPGYRPEGAAALLERMRPLRGSLAVGASADVKFLKPVFAGARLDYRVSITGEFGDKIRFEGEASVDGETVVSATMVGALVTRPVLPER